MREELHRQHEIVQQKDIRLLLDHRPEHLESQLLILALDMVEATLERLFHSSLRFKNRAVRVLPPALQWGDQLRAHPLHQVSRHNRFPRFLSRFLSIHLIRTSLSLYRSSPRGWT